MTAPISPTPTPTVWKITKEGGQKTQKAEGTFTTRDKLGRERNFKVVLLASSTISEDVLRGQLQQLDYTLPALVSESHPLSTLYFNPRKSELIEERADGSVHTLTGENLQLISDQMRKLIKGQFGFYHISEVAKANKPFPIEPLSVQLADLQANLEKSFQVEKSTTGEYTLTVGYATDQSKIAFTLQVLTLVRKILAHKESKDGTFPGIHPEVVKAAYAVVQQVRKENKELQELYRQLGEKQETLTAFENQVSESSKKLNEEIQNLRKGLGKKGLEEAQKKTIQDDILAAQKDLRVLYEHRLAQINQYQKEGLQPIQDRIDETEKRELLDFEAYFLNRCKVHYQRIRLKPGQPETANEKIIKDGVMKNVDPVSSPFSLRDIMQGWLKGNLPQIVLDGNMISHNFSDKLPDLDTVKRVVCALADGVGFSQIDPTFEEGIKKAESLEKLIVILEDLPKRSHSYQSQPYDPALRLNTLLRFYHQRSLQETVSRSLHLSNWEAEGRSQWSDVITRIDSKQGKVDISFFMGMNALYNPIMDETVSAVDPNRTFSYGVQGVLSLDSSMRLDPKNMSFAVQQIQFGAGVTETDRIQIHALLDPLTEQHSISVPRPAGIHMPSKGLDVSVKPFAEQLAFLEAHPAKHFQIERNQAGNFFLTVGDVSDPFTKQVLTLVRVILAQKADKDEIFPGIDPEVAQAAKDVANQIRMGKQEYRNQQEGLFPIKKQLAEFGDMEKRIRQGNFAQIKALEDEIEKAKDQIKKNEQNEPLPNELTKFNTRKKDIEKQIKEIEEGEAGIIKELYAQRAPYDKKKNEIEAQMKKIDQQELSRLDKHLQKRFRLHVYYQKDHPRFIQPAGTDSNNSKTLKSQIRDGIGIYSPIQMSHLPQDWNRGSFPQLVVDGEVSSTKTSGPPTLEVAKKTFLTLAEFVLTPIDPNHPNHPPNLDWFRQKVQEAATVDILFNIVETELEDKAREKILQEQTDIPEMRLMALLRLFNQSSLQQPVINTLHPQGWVPKGNSQWFDIVTRIDTKNKTMEVVFFIGMSAEEQSRKDSDRSFSYGLQGMIRLDHRINPGDKDMIFDVQNIRLGPKTTGTDKDKIVPLLDSIKPKKEPHERKH